MPLIQVLDVSRAVVPNTASTWALDFPQTMQLFDGDSFEVSGWVISGEDPTTIQVWRDAELVCHARALDPRPDVSAVHPGETKAGYSGFRLLVPLNEWHIAEFAIIGVPAAAPPFNIGSIRVRKTWREHVNASDVPFFSVIVTASGWSERLLSSIRSLNAQTYAHFEALTIHDRMNKRDVPPVDVVLTAVRSIELPALEIGDKYCAGLRRTVGDYVLVLREGEELPPEMLETTLATFQAHPESPLAFGRTNAGAPIGIFRRSLFDAIGINETDTLERVYDRVAAQFTVCSIPASISRYST